LKSSIHQPQLSTIGMAEQKLKKKNISDPGISYF